MSRLFQVVFAILVLAVLPPICVADDSVPSVVTMQRGGDELLADLEYLVKLDTKLGAVQWENISVTLDTFLQGIDRTKPIRIDILLGGEQERYRPAFPVANRGQFEQNVSLFGIDIKKAGTNPLIGLDGAFLGFMRYVSGYAVIGEQKVDLPANLPDPAAALKPLLAKGYDVAADIRNAKDGQEDRRKAIRVVRENLLDALKQAEDESDDEFALRTLALTHQMDEIERFFVESSQITMGWTTDVPKKEARFDLDLTAIPETSLEGSIHLLGEKASEFAGVKRSENAILNVRINHPLDEMRKANFLKMFEKLRSSSVNKIESLEERTDEQKTHAKSASDLLFDVMDAGAKSGQLDGFVDVRAHDSGKHTVVGGIVATETEKIPQILELIPQIDPERKVEMNVDSQGDVAIHSVNVPESERADFEDLFGSPAIGYIGVSDSAIWYAAGVDAVKSLKSAIEAAAVKSDSEDEQRKIFDFYVKVGPWIELLDRKRGEKGENIDVRQMAIKAFKDGNDTIIGSLVRNGEQVNGRVVYNEGILRFVGSMIAKISKENLE